MNNSLSVGAGQDERSFLLGNGLLLKELGAKDPGAREAVLPDERVRIEISRGAGAAVVASVVLTLAERAELSWAHGGQPEGLDSSVLLSNVRISDADAVIPSTLLYFAARRARMMGRANLLIRAEEVTFSNDILHLVSCSEAWPEVLTQRVDLAAHYTAQSLEKLAAPMPASVRAREVEEVTKRWLAGGSEWGFFKALRDGTLTRQQYVYALSNIYQFVRHTTRLVARAIAHSPTTEMRTHFIKHMNGEVNHELIIERDLEHLGEDVAYVRDHMAPNGPTQEFMAIQESMIGYYEDPVLLMASPVAAEGVTAHLDQAFADSLHEGLRRWKVGKPEKASRFFISHMHTDGGDDGHWEMTIAFLEGCLTTESKHQFFMRSLRSAMRGTQRLYDSFVTDMPTFTPTAKQHQKVGAQASA